MNIQGSFPLGLTGLISLLSKGLKNLLQHHTVKASVLQCSTFFRVQLLHPHMTTGKTMKMKVLVAQSCLTLCEPMDGSRPRFSVHHQLPKVAQTHVHQIGNAIQPSWTQLSPSPSFNLSQYQGLFQRVSSSHQVAKELGFQLQHQSFQWIFRTDFL